MLTGHAGLKLSYDSCILDGEMLAYDPLIGRYLAFGTLRTAAIGELVRRSSKERPIIEC